MKSMPQYKFKRITASGQVNGTAPCNIMAIMLFGGSANTSALFYNAATAAGTQVFEANTVLATTHFVDLRPLGGINRSTACYVTLAGADGILFVWYG